jgi:hypothetical protein
VAMDRLLIGNHNSNRPLLIAHRFSALRGLCPELEAADRVEELSVAAVFDRLHNKLRIQSAY